LNPIKGVGKYRVCEAEINGRKHLFVSLPYLEYINNPQWRDPAIIKQVIDVLREVQFLTAAMPYAPEDSVIALDGLEGILMSDKVIASSFRFGVLRSLVSSSSFYFLYVCLRYR
jgi:hypothetical protein